MSKFAGEVDEALDFNGQPRGAFTYRGAYAGSGINPGWQLGPSIKPPDGEDGGTAIPVDGGSANDGGAVIDAGQPVGGGASSAPGCGCSQGLDGMLAWAAAALLAQRRRRRR